MTELYWDRLDTAVGPLTVVVDGRGRVTALKFSAVDPAARRNSRRCRDVCGQLREYFTGQRRHFNLRLAPDGTEFQRRVWQGLTEIPYGEAIGYGELARRIDKPGAARAVGQANGANPIPVIIPCHRVISADGSIGGFSSGLTIKRKLLALEDIEIAA